MCMPLRFKSLLSLCMGMLIVATVQPVQAQTKSARGINMSSSAIGAVVPELGTLESEILETVTLMEDIENCAQNSRFYDSVSESCRTTDPVSVEFEQRPDETTVTVQRPNGTSVAYPLDGADGVARDEDGHVIDQEEMGSVESGRYICRRGGVTWEQGGNAQVMGRYGAVTYLCCEGTPIDEAGPIAGITARQWPGIRQHCP